MLVKRAYTSLRFWQAMVTQLILPLSFVIFSMVLARTTLFTDDPSDPKTSLGLRKSSLISGNRTLFWAEFGSSRVAGDGGSGTASGNVSSFFDFSDEVIKICVHVHTLGGKPDGIHYYDCWFTFGMVCACVQCIHVPTCSLDILLHFCTICMHVQNFKLKQQKCVQMCTYCTYTCTITVNGRSVHKHTPVHVHIQCTPYICGPSV